MSNKKRTKAILITNDRKRDWVYKPQKITTHGGRTISNGSYYLPDPRLIDEFKAATGGSEEFYIINFATLVQSLWTAEKGKFKSLSEAVQIKEISIPPTLTTEINENDTSNETEVPETTPLPSTETSKSLQVQNTGLYSTNAYADKDFVPNILSLTAILSNLRTYSWDIQNKGVMAFTEELVNDLDVDANADALFVIGRNIYQAACGNAFTAISFLEKLHESLQGYKSDARFHIANGIYYEIYFNHAGLIRPGNFKTRMLNEVSKLQEHEEYRPTIEFICKELETFKDKGLYLPNNPPIPYNVDLICTFLKHQNDVSIYKIEGITHQNISLLKKDDTENNVFGPGIDSDNISYTTNMLLEKISDKFAVPKKLIEFNTTPKIAAPKVIYQLPEGMDIGWEL